MECILNLPLQTSLRQQRKIFIYSSVDMLPSADAAPVLAYSDASMIGEATAGLGAVVDGKEFTRIVRTSSQP